MGIRETYEPGPVGGNICLRGIDGIVFASLRMRNEKYQVLDELLPEIVMKREDCLTAEGLGMLEGQQKRVFKLTEFYYEGHRVYQEVEEGDDD